LLSRRLSGNRYKARRWLFVLTPGQVESAHADKDHGENNPMSDFRAFGLSFFRVMKFSQATHDISSWM
jgi:hypothetical protein